jgi:hypothetical protein
VEHRQQGVFLHILADIHIDLHYPAPDERGHLGQFIFVGLNCGGKFPRYQQLASDNRRDLDHRPGEFFGCEMEHSRPVSHNRLLGLRHLVGSSLASNKPSECKDDKADCQKTYSVPFALHSCPRVSAYTSIDRCIRPETLGLMVIPFRSRDQHEVCHEKLLI